ncbi:MAG TPA: tetratricopeptide repeat protein [Stellaceae bacterium]|nr:tetratricopeptide repeat protein [Stellaceae bacterium]
MTQASAATGALLAAGGVAEIEPHRLGEAIAELRAAIAAEPRRADLHVLLARCAARAGEFRRALEAAERAIALDPEMLAAYRAAADAALAASKQAAAAGAAKASRDLVRYAAGAVLALGKRQHRQRLDAAEESLREAAALDAKSAEAAWALAEFLQSRGRDGEAEKLARRAIALDPHPAHFYVTLGNSVRARGRWPEMNAAYRKALERNPSLRQVRDAVESIPLLNMIYDEAASGAAILDAHRAWGEAIAAEPRAAAPRFANSRDPERRLKLAFLSPDFRYHAVSFFFQPLLAHLDRGAVEIFCYAEIEDPDPVTAYLQSLGGSWRWSHKLDDRALAAQLRADGIDIAIDLAGHTGGNRLRALALKPAPVLATWLGYPATTGLAAIDWRITDARADPPGQEAFHSERLLRLPESFLCFAAYMTQVPEPAPSPASRSGQVTFGSFNNPQKLSPSAARAWARILAAVPGSRLILKALAFTEPEQRQKFLDRLAAYGIPPERVALRLPQPAMPDHLGSYAEIDIALDPFPYNGTTTTCEAMWMGVPVITLIGAHHAGRVGFDLLSQLGLEELAAPDIDAYVETAVALAGDRARLERWRGELRERMRASPLCDAPRFARDFESGLRRMWREWCAS